MISRSHVSAKSDSERAMDPYECIWPGQKTVRLKAGDAVFYDNNILYRGCYDSKIPRMTLYGSIEHVTGKEVRARDVPQHGVGS